jgi:hypothetical protein
MTATLYTPLLARLSLKSLPFPIGRKLLPAGFFRIESGDAANGLYHARDFVHHDHISLDRR